MIDTARTVADAWSFLGLVDYDLLVLDLCLPDGEGADMLRELRRAGQSLPVLVATARIEVHRRVATLNDGADDDGEAFDRDELIAAPVEFVGHGCGRSPFCAPRPDAQPRPAHL